MTKYFLVFLIFLSACVSLQAKRQISPQENRMVSAFLNDKKADGGTRAQGYEVNDIDKDSVPEIILVWTFLGPTYWYNTLTVLRPEEGGYEELASLQLKGEAHLSHILGNRIYVDQKVYDEDDPLCCPTVKKQNIYQFSEKLTEVTDVK